MQKGKSSKAIKSNKNINIPIKRKKSKLGIMPQSLQIIKHNCKSDHLKTTLIDTTSSKISLYSKHYPHKSTNKSQKINQQLEKFENKQNIPIKSNSLSTYQLYQKYGQNNHKLPSIHEGSSYKKSFIRVQPEKIVKEKEKQSFFLNQKRALPALSQYRKSYQASTQKQNILNNQKGRPSRDHLFIPKYSHFRGSSSYKDEYFGRLSKAINADDCIKNKDHLNKKNIYPSLYQKSQSHKNYDRKDSYRESNEDISYKYSNNEHFFPSSRVSTFGQYQSMYKNVFHKPFEEQNISKQ